MAKAPVAQHAFAKTLKTFTTASGKTGRYYSLPELARQFPSVSRLPVSIRLVLESVPVSYTHLTLPTKRIV